MKQALTSSNIGQTLITLAAKNSFDHRSGNAIRHGYMAVVVKIANLLVKNKNKEEVGAYLESLGEDWKNFAEGELKKSNDTNSKSLGGQQPRSQPGDDDDMEGSMSMDSILSRFSNFSSERNKRETINSNNHDDDDDEDEDEDEEEHHEGGEHKEHKTEENEDKLTFLKDRDQEYQQETEKQHIIQTKPLE